MTAAQLLTPSLLLRATQAEHLAALTQLLHQPRVRRYLLDDQLMPPSWVEAQIAASTARFAESSLGLFAVFERKRPDHLIGIAGGIVTEDGSEPELIYALGESFHGRGLGQEMTQAVIDFAFHELGWRQITATVDRPNRHSVALLQRLGFEQIDAHTGRQPSVLKYGRTRAS